MNMKWIEKHDPVQERSAMHWEQGLTLGNGKIGAVVWGGYSSMICTGLDLHMRSLHVTWALR